jgi:hypothetical protein
MIGVADSVSASTFGYAPQGAFNNGFNTIYGSNTRMGWYGASLHLIGGPSDIDVYFLGKEASHQNSFQFPGGTTVVSTAGLSNGFSLPATPAATIGSVVSGLLDLIFTTTNGRTTRSVANGSNPDELAGQLGVNFFVTFVHDQFAHAGKVVDLWFDDQVQGDDNHDDLGIRLAISGGNGHFAVPLPAGLVLMLTAVAVFGAAARRRLAA